MPPRPYISIAKPKIELLLDQHKKNCFKISELEHIFSQNKADWRLPFTLSFTKWLNYLMEKSHMKELVLHFPQRTYKVYLWRDWQEYMIWELALSLHSNSYISHYSAVFLHDLTEQIPKNIFITYRTARNQPTRHTTLTQDTIDAVFAREARTTKNFCQFKNHHIFLIEENGASKPGVIQKEYQQGSLKVTDLERTLIDILVRPNYSGGIYEVLKAFKLSVDKAQVNRLKAYLQKMNFLYPYSQALGFCLEYAGFSEKRLRLIESTISHEFTFYLIHGISNKAFSKKWNLYYPAEIEIEMD